VQVNKRNAGGFSILELMIALLLGLIVVAGIVQLFVGNSRTYEIVNAQSRLQENARFAYEFITRAARSAGYFGCAPEADKIANQLQAGSNWDNIPEYNLFEPVAGWQSNGDGTYVPDDLTTLPRSEGGVNVNVHIAGNGIDRNELADDADLLVFRSLRRPTARLDETLQPTADPVVATPGGTPAFAFNDVVMVSDCEQAAVFRVTQVNTTVDTTTLQRLVTGGGTLFENVDPIVTNTGDVVPATLSLVGRSFGQDAVVGVVESTFFFIAPSVQPDNQGNDVNALWQKVGNAAPVELIQGVTDMQIQYGVDLTVDNVVNVNQYQTFEAVADPTTIVAVLITLDVTSVDVLAELGNQALTRTFSKTIHVRNAG